MRRNASRSCGEPSRPTVRAAIPPPAQCTDIENRPSSAPAATAARDVGLRRHVAPHEQRVRPELRRDRVAPLLGEVGEHHRRAVRVQPPGRRLAETRCRAGYEGDVATDFHVCAPFAPSRSATCFDLGRARHPRPRTRRCATATTVPTFSPLRVVDPDLRAHVAARVEREACTPRRRAPRASPRARRSRPTTRRCTTPRPPRRRRRGSHRRARRPSRGVR